MLKLGTYGRDVLNLKFRLDEIIKTNTFISWHEMGAEGNVFFYLYVFMLSCRKSYYVVR